MPILFLFLNILTTGQSEKFNHLTNDDGLSQNTINCMYQDSHGFMWFGTQDGLNRYDGYEFKIFRNDPGDTNSISHSWIWDIFEDSNSKLWIATWRGLTKYDPVNNTYTRFLPDPDNPNFIQGERPTTICEDDDGYIWIGTWGGGLNRYNPQTGNFSHFRYSNNNTEGITDDFVRKIYLDSKKNLWIGTWNGLSCLYKDNLGKYKIKNYKHDPTDTNSISSNQVTAITEDMNGNMWFGTFGKGINKYDPTQNKFSHYKHDPANPGSLSNNNISVICEDRKGDLWVGTISGGLNKLDKSKSSFTHIPHKPDDENSLIGNSVYSIFEDKSGLIWIGAGGLNIYNRNQNKFKHFAYNPSSSNGLSNNKIICFLEDKHGDIWIGTETGGINQYNTQSGIFLSYKNDPTNQFSLSNDNISAITKDIGGNIWISTRGGGINRYDTKSGKFTHFKESEYIPESKGLNYINGIRIDSSGVMWLATYDKGLIKYDIKNNKYTKFTSKPDDPTSISGNYLLRIFIDSKERIWLGSWGGGLSLYNRKTNSFTRFLNDPNDQESICGNIVHSIYETNIGNTKTLWLGTSSGLSSMNIGDSISGIFNNIFIKDGLPSNVIYGILEDNSGSLWISTNHGICNYDPQTNTFKNYDYKDGIQSNEFNGGASLKLKNGELLFGGVNGYNSFHPDSIKESNFPPQVVFTAFNIFDQAQNLDQVADTTNTIMLSYRQNFFSFEFAALDFSQPENNKYQYFMKGVDKEWIEAGNRRYVSYPDIDPGNYVFRVRGSNSDGVWSPNEAFLKIHISPPYWQTIWFKFGVAALIILTLYALHRYRLTRLLEIERLRIRIASDLHDEIGSALTRIAIHSEQIQSSKDNNRVLISSKKIGIISREVISTMSDIVWSIDARNDNLNDLLDRIFDFTHSTLSVQDVKVSFSQSGLDKSKKIKINYRQNIYYILKEAINNIVKHASATEVKIIMQNDDKNFKLQIIDNGKGYDSTKIRPGNGLRNMQMRAERIGGSLTIDTNKGTKILLQMKKL